MNLETDLLNFLNYQASWGFPGGGNEGLIPKMLVSFYTYAAHLIFLVQNSLDLVILRPTPKLGLILSGVCYAAVNIAGHIDFSS